MAGVELSMIGVSKLVCRYADLFRHVHFAGRRPGRPGTMALFRQHYVYCVLGGRCFSNAVPQARQIDAGVHRISCPKHHRRDCK